LADYKVEFTVKYGASAALVLGKSEEVVTLTYTAGFGDPNTTLKSGVISVTQEDTSVKVIPVAAAASITYKVI
jgi:hypothetical protein